MMSAAATRSIRPEHHVAELDRLQRVILDRVIHPGAGNALANKDEQMRGAEWIGFRAAAVKRGMRYHRVGEVDRHAGKHLADHLAGTIDVEGNDGVAELAQPAKARNRDADLREPDAPPPRRVAQQCQRFAKHPADGLDGWFGRQRYARGVT